MARRRHRSPKIGDIRIEELRDEDLRRYVRTAKLFPEDGTVVFGAPLPELHGQPGLRVVDAVDPLEARQRECLLAHADYPDGALEHLGGR